MLPFTYGHAFPIILHASFNLICSPFFKSNSLFPSGPLVNVVIPRPGPNGELGPGVGKVCNKPLPLNEEFGGRLSSFWCFVLNYSAYPHVFFRLILIYYNFLNVFLTYFHNLLDLIVA